MARMFPERVLDDTKSAAERKIYGLLKENLGDSFTVFHGVGLIGQSPEGRRFDGEVDFVIAHPDLGILVLEVKGGRISFDGTTGTWASVDRNGVRNVLHRDPVTQAKDERYGLFRKLKAARQTSRFTYKVCHGLCFPDVLWVQDLRLDLPVDIVIDQHDLGNLDAAVRRIYGFWGHPGPGPRPGPGGIDALAELISPRVVIRSYLGADIEDERSQFRTLTQQQYLALDLLSRERRALVLGCAGSGKTMLALEKARRLAEEGYSVLLTCFNARLADWIEASPAIVDGITVSSFHKLCLEQARKAGVLVPGLHSDIVEGDEEYYFGTLLPQALLDASRNLGARFNAIVVDEGQDFIDSWWVALEALLSDPKQDVFYIFADDNQNIYAGAEQNYPFTSPAISLSKNCRNTRSIHTVVAQRYRGALQIGCDGPDGRPVEVLGVLPTAGLGKTILRRLQELIEVERVRAQDIVVLSPRSSQTSLLAEGTSLGSYSLTWKAPIRPNQIECSSIHAFKGLERPIVVVAEADRLESEDRDRLLYVAVSRPTNHLIIVGNID